MIEFIPYFAGLVTLLFGVAFGYAITDGWNFKKKKKKAPFKQNESTSNS